MYTEIWILLSTDIVILNVHKTLYSIECGHSLNVHRGLYSIEYGHSINVHKIGDWQTGWWENCNY